VSSSAQLHPPSQHSLLDKTPKRPGKQIRRILNGDLGIAPRGPRRSSPKLPELLLNDVGTPQVPVEKHAPGRELRPRACLHCRRCSSSVVPINRSGHEAGGVQHSMRGGPTSQLHRSDSIPRVLPPPPQRGIRAPPRRGDRAIVHFSAVATARGLPCLGEQLMNLAACHVEIRLVHRSLQRRLQRRHRLGRSPESDECARELVVRACVAKVPGQHRPPKLGDRGLVVALCRQPHTADVMIQPTVEGEPARTA